jgi:hypothetical protein
MSSTTMSSTTVESTASTTVESTATAAVESAATTTVEAATTMRLEVSAATAAAKPASAAAEVTASALRSEAPAVREPSAIEAPAVEAPAVEAPAVEAPPIEAPAIKSPAIKSPVKVATPIESTPEAPAVPGSDSDEHAVREVIRSPIAVRGASVRSVIIVAVAAHRRPVIGITSISATHANSHRNLCVRIARRKHTNR